MFRLRIILQLQALLLEVAWQLLKTCLCSPACGSLVSVDVLCFGCCLRMCCSMAGSSCMVMVHLHA